MANKIIKYATIGTSWITDSFIEGAKKVNGLTLFGVFSRSAEKAIEFAKKHNVKNSFSNLNTLADCKDIDAVYIASPNSLHYEQSRQMLLSGKHVICEKPITVTPDEVLELTKLAKEKGLVYMEAIMSLHTPALECLKKALIKIGKVTSAHLDFSQLSSKYPLLKDGEIPNIFDPDLATGCLMDLGVYNVYVALELFGLPEDIVSSSQFLHTGADCLGTAIFNYSDKQVTLTYSKLGQNHSGSYILGDKGTIVIESISQLTGIKIIYSDKTTDDVFACLDKSALMGNEAQSFYNYIISPLKYSKEYENAQKMAIDVSRQMKTIRNQNTSFKF